MKMVAKVAVKKIGYDLGYEDGCELGCKFGMSDGYKFVQKKKEQRMQMQRARRNARVGTQHRPTQTSLHTNAYSSITHSAEDSNKKRRSLTHLFLRRGEKKAARGVDGVDGVAGSLALPATMSSSVWHDEEEGSKARRG